MGAEGAHPLSIKNAAASALAARFSQALDTENQCANAPQFLFS
jgi:hypothetical protein